MYKTYPYARLASDRLMELNKGMASLADSYWGLADAKFKLSD